MLKILYAMWYHKLWESVWTLASVILLQWITALFSNKQPVNWKGPIGPRQRIQLSIM